MVEYRPEYDKFGTPRIFENTPIFANQPTFEGLLTESAISNYFHFINQTETTKKPSAAIAGFEYPPFNFENGVKHLKLFGAKYFVAYTPEIKELANKYLKKLVDKGEFSVYSVSDSNLVVSLNQIELEPKVKKWIDQSIEWYKKMDFSKPIVFYKNKKELRELEEIAKNTFLEECPLAEITKITNDSLSFNTQCLNQPHLIKISYFPGWQVKGAYGPYLISPSFMMVIPFQNEVNLRYFYNTWDILGLVITVISLIVLALIILRFLLL